MTESVPLPLCRVHALERRELGYCLGGQISVTKGRDFYVICHAPRARVLYSTLRRQPTVVLCPQNLFLNLSGSRSTPETMAPLDLAENGNKNFRRARGGEMGKILTLLVSVMKIVMPTAQHSGHTIWVIYMDLPAQKSPKSRTRDL